MSVIISGFLASATKQIVLIFTNIFNPTIETGKFVREKGNKKKRIQFAQLRFESCLKHTNEKFK